MPRPPLKKTEKLAYRQALGATLGEFRAKVRIAKMQDGIKQAVTDTLRDMLKNVNPVELAAVFAGTYVVYTTIKYSPELSLKATQYATAYGLLGVAGIAVQYIADVYMPTPLRKLEIPKSKEFPLWIISFFVAYVLIKHGGQLFGLMREGAGNLTAVISALLA